MMTAIRRRIVVATADSVTPKMAGPAIRAWQIASALSREHDVRLVTTTRCTVAQPDGFRVSAIDDRGLREAERWCDVFIFQGWVMASRPYLRDSEKIVVVDIYDPIHLEQLEQGRGERDAKRHRVMHAASAVLNEQLLRGDFFICASDKQRDFWLGHLATLGRVNPVTYDEDETLRSLISVVPFGISDDRLRDFLAPLPLELVPMESRRRAELHELGVKRVGQLAGLPGAAVAERLGPDGRRAWGLARGGKAARVRGRRPPAEIVEALEFPEAVGNELTLRRAFGALLETVLARPERADRFVRKLALSARLVGGGSWRRSVTLRDATTEPGRLKAALGPKLAELPAPVLELRLEFVELTEHDGRQLELLPAAGGELNTRLREGLRQVRASTGSGSVNQVVEVAPWSRIPEARALFVPRDDC